MAQKGKKKPSEGDQPRRKGRTVKKSGNSSEQDLEGSASADWAPGAEIAAGESERILDVDPSREIEDKAREFGPSDNPFLPRDPHRLPEENPFLDAPPADEEVKERPEPGPSGRFEDARPADGTPDALFLDPAVRAGQGRAAAEDVLKGRGLARERPGGMPPGTGFLDALFLDFPFPANMEAVACHLARDANHNGGPAEVYHDLVIQLDQTWFKDIHDLKGALRDRFAWEAAHGRPEGGNHGR